jgi:hypothetical protein
MKCIFFKVNDGNLKSLRQLVDEKIMEGKNEGRGA